MPPKHTPTIGLIDGPSIRPLQPLGPGRLMAGILGLTLLHSVESASGITSAVSLAWDRSPRADVTGYRIHHGVVTGNYTHRVNVGNVTTGTVSGLAAGTDHFFVVSAYTALGLESDYSEEVSFVAKPPPPPIRVTPGNRVVVTAKGVAGQQYEVWVTDTFVSWSLLGTVTMDASGSVNFMDPRDASRPGRFYRLQPRH